MGAASAIPGKVIGRYVLYDEIAAGGMATVHLGRLLGAAGFTRTVAIKRLHAGLVRDQDFSTMFMDEARLAARIRHPNVVSVLDVVHEQGELFLVMDYVQGESLARLWREVRPGTLPTRVGMTAIAGVLHGLHAAHEATTEHGEPLGIVHRDVSPQNVMIGIDGVARVLDFGVAKAANRVQTTKEGTVKGKISYMAPEQLLSEDVDRRADIYAAAVVAWEVLTGERLFDGENQGRIVRKILDEEVPPPSAKVPGLSPGLDQVVMKGLEKAAKNRWQTAREFASALERALPTAPLTDIGEFVESIAGPSLSKRAKRVKEIESRSDILPAARQALPTVPARESNAPGLQVPSTKPQPFAVMRDRSDEIEVSISEPPLEGLGTPMPGSGMVPKAPRPPTPIEPMPSKPPVTAATPVSEPRLRISSPFAPMPVQTLAVTPMARLDAVAAPRIDDLLKQKAGAHPTPATFDVTPTDPEPLPAQRKRGIGRVLLILTILLVVLGAAGGAAFRLLLKH